MHKVVDEIIESNKWRDGEFAKFKVISKGPDAKLWCRMCIPMIYAHWEGFVVSSLKLLIQHLNTLKLEPRSVPTNLIVIGLGDSFQSLSGKQSFDQRIAFTDNFQLLLDKTIKFDKKVNTKSNLHSNVLNELCSMFSFEYNKFNDCITLLDRLVQIRNSIAHGENSFVITPQNIEDYINNVNKATDIFTNEIELFLSNECYLINKQV
ncbi:MAE_28990/MAE_18760 family HEPN-like nuclease [Aliivibrio fischeri]|uniref:MAE_28990/MAE_18760 family HEPN-like nuclease n=1 Tax=Aliivibrio fischeri TaxID=668 RepID=UPI0037350DB3